MHLNSSQFLINDTMKMPSSLTSLHIPWLSSCLLSPSLFPSRTREGEGEEMGGRKSGRLEGRRRAAQWEAGGSVCLPAPAHCTTAHRLPHCSFSLSLHLPGGGMAYIMMMVAFLAFLHFYVSSPSSFIHHSIIPSGSSHQSILSKCNLSICSLIDDGNQWCVWLVLCLCL